MVRITPPHLRWEGDERCAVEDTANIDEVGWFEIKEVTAEEPIALALESIERLSTGPSTGPSTGLNGFDACLDEEIATGDRREFDADDLMARIAQPAHVVTLSAERDENFGGALLRKRRPMFDQERVHIFLMEAELIALPTFVPEGSFQEFIPCYAGECARYVGSFCASGRGDEYAIS